MFLVKEWLPVYIVVLRQRDMSCGSICVNWFLLARLKRCVEKTKEVAFLYIKWLRTHLLVKTMYQVVLYANILLAFYLSDRCKQILIYFGIRRIVNSIYIKIN